MKKLNLIVTQLGRIGDMILLTPVFNALKEYNSDIDITVVASKHNHFVLKNNPNIDKILIYDKKIINSLKLLSFLRSKKYDWLVDPKDHHSTESQMIAKIIMADKKVGFNKGRGSFDIELEKAKPFTHYARKMFTAFLAMGLYEREKLAKPDIYEAEESRYYSKEFAGRLGEKFELINISASKEWKMWDNDKWIEFINSINKIRKITRVLTFAPSERERAEYIREKTENTHCFYSRSLIDVFSIVNLCSLVITVDTAMVHISAGFNKPLLGLFGGLESEYKKFEPLNDSFIAIRNKDGVDGVKEIEVNKVKEAYMQMINN